MAQQYYRDPNNTNVLLNKSNSHTSRLAVKRNFLKQKTEISDLKTQLDELRAIVEGLTGE
jgi:hypothetical protein